MTEERCWQMDPEHLEESVRVMRTLYNLALESALSVRSLSGVWQPLLRSKLFDETTQDVLGVVDGLALTGTFKTTFVAELPMEPGLVRVVRDEQMDGILVTVDNKPTIGIAGPRLVGLPTGLLHLEAAFAGSDEFGSMRKMPVGFPASSELRSLTIQDGGDIEDDVSILSRHTHLRQLRLEKFSRLKDVCSLAGLSSLTSLSLSGCSWMEDISGLSGLKTLTKLNLDGCRCLEDFSPLAELSALTHLNLEGCYCLRDIGHLSGLSALVMLSVAECPELQGIGALAGMTRLNVLNMNGCGKLQDIGALAGLSRLSTLSLDHCYNVKSFSSLSGLSGLTGLAMSYMPQLGERQEHLRSLSGLTGLVRVKLSDNLAITDVRPLTALTNLSELYLRSCPHTRHVQALGQLSKLRTFEHDNESLVSLVLAQSATSRRDVVFIAEKVSEWINTIRLSDTPDRLVTTLAGAIGAGAAEAWAAGAARELAFACRSRAELDPDTWFAVFTVAVACGDPGLRSAFDIALVDLDLDSDALRILIPALRSLSFAPACARSWAVGLCRPILDNVRLHAYAREVAPAAALFFESVEDPAARNEWISVATDPASPVWRDRVFGALVEYDLRVGKTASARQRVQEMVTPSVADEARSRIAEHLSTSAPEEAVAVIESIVDDARRWSAASFVMGCLGATSSAAACYALLGAVDAKPDLAYDVLRQIVAQHPESSFASEIAACFGDGAAPELHFAMLDKLLEAGLLKKKQVASVKQAWAARGTDQSWLLAQGLVAHLVEEEVLDESEVAEALDAVSMGGRRS